ncbi:MAG: N-acetylmuramoyl-L-alanine amidase [Chloroflexota bacterium]
MKQLAYSRFRRALVPILVGSLAVAALPAVHIEASGPVRVAASELHGSLERERTFALPFAASHVALHWSGQAAAQVTVAFSLDGRTFGPPIPVERDEVGEGRANGETYGNLLLAGGARFVRVTSDRTLAHLSVLDLDARGAGQASIRFGSVAAAAAAAQPAVISRAGWNADESLRFDATGHEIWPPVFQTIQKLIVHHTATQNNDPDAAATVRAIYYYHAVTQGWGDIGYNFLIDEAGRIYEGRYARTYGPGESPTGEDTAGNGVTGAHALGFNSGTVGIAFLGTLTNQDATPAARDALTRLLAWIAAGHGIDPHGSALFTNPVSGTQATFPNIAGHRDVNATECPGSVFYGTLPALRDAVAALIAGTPTPDFTISASPATQTVTAGQQTSYTATVTPSGGFSGAVNLAVSGLPANTTFSWSTNPLPGGGGMSTLTVTTLASTPVGTSTLTMSGTSGTLTHTTAVTLVVTAPPTPEFSLTLSPASQSVRGGGSVGYTVTVTSLNGFAGAVSLSVSGLPSGSSGSFNPTSVTVAPTGTSILTIKTARTPRGTFPFTVTGKSGSLSRTTTGTLRVSKQ